MNWLAMIPAAMTLFGSFMGKEGADEAADASVVQAQLARKGAEFTALQLEQRGEQAVAISQRNVQANQLQSDLIASRQLAVAAASGGGASDPTIINLIAKTRSVSAYKTAIDLYQGEETERQLRLQAAAKRYEGDLGIIAGNAKAQSYETAGTASLLTGAGSLFAKFGMGGFGASSGASSAAAGSSAAFGPGASDIGSSMAAYG